MTKLLMFEVDVKKCDKGKVRRGPAQVWGSDDTLSCDLSRSRSDTVTEINSIMWLVQVTRGRTGNIRL